MDDKGEEKKEEKDKGDQVKGRQAEIYQIDMDHALKVLSMQEDEPEVQEVVDVVTTVKLITEVVTAPIRVDAASTRRSKRVVIRDPEEESTTIIPADTKYKDNGKGIMLKRRVKKLERGNRVKVLKLRRLKKVGTSQRIDSSDDTAMKDASNQERMIDELDRDEGVALKDDNEKEKKAEEARVAGDDQVKGRQAEIYQIDMDHASKVLSMQEDEPKGQEVMDVVTTAKLITEVVTAASESVNAASTTIAAAEPQVPAAEPQVPDATITAAPVRVAAASTRRRKGVVIRDPEEESTTIILTDTKSKDKGKRIMVEEPKPIKKKQQVEMDEEYARKLHAELNKDIKWDVAIDHVKQKAKEDSAVQRYQVMKKRPQTEAQARKNMIMYLKND
nr:hypothetical protein [Tanacetum cinerariifolium]